jgi:hypothetical protein
MMETKNMQKGRATKINLIQSNVFEIEFYLKSWAHLSAIVGPAKVG